MYLTEFEINLISFDLIILFGDQCVLVSVANKKCARCTASFASQRTLRQTNKHTYTSHPATAQFVSLSKFTRS